MKTLEQIERDILLRFTAYDKTLERFTEDIRKPLAYHMEKNPGDSMTYLKAYEILEDADYLLINKETSSVANRIEFLHALTHKKVIKVKYHDKEMEELEFINGISDWIDLRLAKDYDLKSGDFAYLNLGVSMELPYGYEAHLAPRSSLFKKQGLLQTNSVGVIDESFCGDNDVWHMPVLATGDVKLEKGTRLCQFRIMKKMTDVELETVEHLGNEDRQGFGSTGEK